jgi:hypothetical protein
MSKKRLKIPKGLSEAVSCINLRPKGNKMICKTLHRKLKIEQHESSKNQELDQVLWKDAQLLLR